MAVCCLEVIPVCQLNTITIYLLFSTLTKNIVHTHTLMRQAGPLDTSPEGIATHLTEYIYRTPATDAFVGVKCFHT